MVLADDLLRHAGRERGEVAVVDGDRVAELDLHVDLDLVRGGDALGHAAAARRARGGGCVSDTARIVPEDVAVVRDDVAGGAGVDAGRR